MNIAALVEHINVRASGTTHLLVGTHSCVGTSLSIDVTFGSCGITVIVPCGKCMYQFLLGGTYDRLNVSRWSSISLAKISRRAHQSGSVGSFVSKGLWYEGTTFLCC